MRFGGFAGRLSAVRSALPRVALWLVPLASTAAFYFLISSFSARLFAQWLHVGAEGLDFAVQLLIGYALFSISRRIWAFLVVQGLLMGILYIGNAVMIRFFQLPIQPADLNSLGALVEILPPWQLAYLAVPAALMAGLFLWNLRLRPARAAIFVVLLGVPSALVAAYPQAYVHFVDSRNDIGYAEWDQLQSYLDRGPVIYFSEAGVRSMLAAPDVPTRQAVARALSRAPITPHGGAAAGAFPKRNLHIILVESFWDPAALSAAHLSEPPWPKALEQLWAETGHSRALSPVFGHLTANAEYEVLCGEPALEDVAIFVSRVRQALPCLPRYLAQHGYVTIVQHPNMMNFWNRVSAYRYLGFQRYYSKKDFNLDQLDVSYLTDASLLDQAYAHARELAGNRPYLDYIMTLAGHYPYRLNDKLHPEVIKTTYGGLLQREVNSIHYTAQALLEHIEQLRRNDPDGIIVVAGDHLPSYGSAMSAYEKSGLFPLDTAHASPAQFKNHQGTPLIVINGRKGPVHMGDVPMYELPARIMRLLGAKPPAIFRLFAAPDNIHIRNYQGLTLVSRPGGPSEVCHAGINDALCRIASDWNQRAEVLSTDLLSGKQYSVDETMGDGYSLAAPKPSFTYIPSSRAKPCSVDVVAWGPRFIAKGKSIHQPGGHSAFWVKFRSASSDVKLRFDGKPLTTQRRSNLLTGSMKPFGTFDSAGKYPLDAICRYSPGVVHVGEFTVRGR